MMKRCLLAVFKWLLLFLWKLHKPLVRKNIELENLHAGETCFLVANGGSLKYYDISKLPQNPVMVNSYSLIDKRLESLNVKYLVTTDSYSLYSWAYNTLPHVQAFQKNKGIPLLSDVFIKAKNIKIFVNVTNFYSTLCRRKNINYYHHFGDKEYFGHDLSGRFSNCRGALDTMLALAKYLGFSKVVLLGCDYLGTPTMCGHVYADRKPFTVAEDRHAEYRARIKVASEGIDVLVILPEGITSPNFEYDSYESYFNLNRTYQENTDFISAEHIDLLRDAAKSNQAYM